MPIGLGDRGLEKLLSKADVGYWYPKDKSDFGIPNGGYLASFVSLSRYSPLVGSAN